MVDNERLIDLWMVIILNIVK